MKFSSLSSGSKQNCFYIEHEEDAILIDTGISYEKLKYFLSRLGRDSRRIKAVFITHEHQDHIRGLRSIIRALHVPVYLHPDSRANLPYKLKTYQDLYHGQTIRVGALSIQSFDVNHDAAHTFGYRVCQMDQVCMFLASDIGSFHDGILELARNCRLLAIESNYDLEMLRRSSYPLDIKQRILSNRGHLSNTGCVEFLKRTINEKTSQVCLLHLSENNNTHDLVRNQVQDVVQPICPHVNFCIAPRELPMDFIEI